MSSKRNKEYARDCLPVIDVGEIKKNIIRDAAFMLELPNGIAEFERRFHSAYLEKFIEDCGLTIIEGMVVKK